MTTDIGKELALWRTGTDSLFNRMLSRKGIGDWWPAMEELTDFREPLADLEETNKEFVLTLDVPGVEKKDIHVRPRDHGIEIEAKKGSEIKEERKGIYLHERSFSGFYRYCALGDSAQADKAQATLKNGVLEVRIPKHPDMAKKAKEIEVK